MNKRLFTVITILITFCALYLAFRNTDITRIVDYMRRGNYIYVIPAFAGLILYGYFRALRWGYFFDVKPRAGLLFSATMIGQMANNIFPARAGEFLKAYLLGKHARISKSGCLATVMLERVWDGLTILLFIGIFGACLLLSGSSAARNTWQAPAIRLAVYMSAAVYILILALAVLWKIKHDRATAFITAVIARVSPRMAGYAAGRLAAFSAGFSVFHSARKIVVVTVYSILIWLLAVATLFLMFKVFSLALSFAAAFILVVLIGLFVMIPTVGSLGTMQLAFVIGLAMYGIDKNEALSFSIVYQFFDTVPFVIIGLVYFFRDGLSLRAVSALTEEKK